MIRKVYLVFNTAVIVALLASYFVFKEGSYTSSLFYYLFPLPVILIIVLFLSIFLCHKFRKYNFYLAALLLLVWLGGSFKVHFSEIINENDLEIVFWNASRKNSFKEAFILNKSIPDVLVLVESARINIGELEREYPNYYFYMSGKEMAIFSKIPLKIIRSHTSASNSNLINFETINLNFYAIDIQGDQDTPRKKELKFVENLITKKENTIILGDFNAPYESKFLDKIKINFYHAFNEKGNGFRETWFWNIPLLSLDHIWISQDLDILKTKKTGTFKSDHNMIKTYIRN